MVNDSLHSLKSVPLEQACTSKISPWAVPGEKCCTKAPVMETIIQKREKIVRNYLYTILFQRNKDPTVTRISAMNLKATHNLKIQR